MNGNALNVGTCSPLTSKFIYTARNVAVTICLKLSNLNLTHKENRMTPQAHEVLTYLKQHRTIGPKEAWTKLGVYRLAARIKEIRDAGHDIETIRVYQDAKTYYGKYIYKGEKRV